MEELINILNEGLNEQLEQIILSNAKDASQGFKAKIRPVLIKDELFFQESLYIETKVFHENYDKEEMKLRLCKLLSEQFKQAQLSSKLFDCTILVSKKGKITIKKKRKQLENKESCSEINKDALLHNRTKQYILKEGQVVDFLVGLGVQTPDGKISKNRYDKFKQINRYLEFIEDVLDKLPNDRTVRIIDFGCGKSYLTFAMYYYLHVVEGRDIKVTGLDLKKDVIEHCNNLARKLNYDKLSFERGDIATYEGESAVDMVVSLHACDTATDYALEKAIKWGASVIMAVPCCQHEINKQIKNDELKPVLKYGIIKERISALMTDALRANLLEQSGYDAQILEFIDMEHTPKNILIRAVKNKNMKPAGRSSDISRIKESFNLDPTLDRLLNS